MDVRSPAVAGQFYPREKSALIDEIEYNLEAENNRINIALAEKRIFGGVSPHAGYIFCLPQAIHLFKILRKAELKRERIVVINPNHTGWGAPLSVDSHSRWSTPLGQTEVDRELADFIIEGSRHSEHPVQREAQAHKREHAGEVILPLLQYFLSDFLLLPLCMGDCSFEAAETIAKELARFADEKGAEPLIIASSDFTHYMSPEEGRRLDDYALDAVLNLDTKEFYRRVGEKRLSICGYGPIMVLLEYAKRKGHNPKVTLLKRGHSGESSYFQGQEQQEVVDYVSLLVHEE